MPINIKIRAGFARAFKGRSLASQEEALRAYGIKNIYSAPKESLADAKRGQLRAAGDAIAVSGGLRVLADTRLAIVAEASQFIAKCFIILDIDTGERSDCHGIEMLNRAIYRVNRERRTPDPKKQAEHGAEGGKAKGRAASGKRLGIRTARAVWRNTKDYPTIAEALEAMPGWTRETAYTHLKKRGSKPGRRPN